MAGKLTAKAVAGLAAKDRYSPGRHTDGDGLHLHVRADGAASWVLRFRLHGRQRDLGLGGYPAIGLANARTLAREAQTLVAKGVDPTFERRKGREAAALAASPDRTFRAAAEALIEARRDGWRNAKHAAQWTATLKRHAYPALGQMPVTDVDTGVVLKVLQGVWTHAPETASRLRGRIEAVLDFARARGWRTGENPARWRGHLAELLPPPRKVAPVVNHPSLPWPELPAFMAALSKRDGVAAYALRFGILTAARTGEVRGMTWAEVDMERMVWTVPAKRMKGARLHRIPLPPEALGVLNEMRLLSARHDSFVFPGGRAGKALSDMALSMLVRGMGTDGLKEDQLPRWKDPDGRAVVPHGFRTSFRGWTRAKAWPDHLGEIALAHADRDKVRAAYARDDLLEERRPMMEAWATWCSGAVVRHPSQEAVGATGRQVSPWC